MKTPDNTIDFEVVSPQEAAAAGSPAEQPSISPEALDAKYVASGPTAPKPEEQIQAKKIVETLNAAPIPQKTESQEPSSVDAAPEEESKLNPSDFMREFGGKGAEATLKGSSVPPSEKGAAQFFEKRRIGPLGKSLIPGGLAASGALAALTSSYFAGAGLSMGTALTSLSLPALAAAAPAIPAAIALYYVGKGVRNILVERAFKKNFGKTVEEALA